MSQSELNRLRKLSEWRHLSERTDQMTDRQIDTVFRKEYFDRPQIGKLAAVPGLAEAAPKLSEQVFDSGILHGIEDAGKWLQESLDEVTGSDLRTQTSSNDKTYDGIIGTQTRHAVQQAVRSGKIKEVNNRIVEKRISHMKTKVQTDPRSVKYLGGWLARAESFSLD